MVMTFMSLQCEKRLFFFLDKKAILYNILLLFGGPLTSRVLRRWPEWPIGSISTAHDDSFSRWLMHTSYLAPSCYKGHVFSTHLKSFFLLKPISLLVITIWSLTWHHKHSELLNPLRKLLFLSYCFHLSFLICFSKKKKKKFLNPLIIIILIRYCFMRFFFASAFFFFSFFIGDISCIIIMNGEILFCALMVSFIATTTTIIIYASLYVITIFFFFLEILLLVYLYDNKIIKWQ